MAVKSKSVTLPLTTITLIANESSFVYVQTGAVAVNLGGSDVSAANGFVVAANSTSPLIELRSGDSLYGFAGTATSVKVIQLGL